MARIALAPVWDCFGPASKALVVGKELETRHHGCFYMMAHSQADLAEPMPNGRMRVGAVSQSKDMRAWLAETRPDVLIGFGGANALAEAQTAGIPTVAVVSLGWRLTPEIRPKQWEVCLKANAVCLQRLGNWQPPAELGAHLVDAIIDTSGKWSWGSGILVNVGGVRVGGLLGHKKAFWLASMADTLLKWDGALLTIAGDDMALTGNLKPTVSRPGIEIGQLARREYLDALASAEALITAPGLTGIAEGYAYEIPVAVMRSAVTSHMGNVEKLEEYNMLAQPIFDDLASALEWAETAPNSALSAVLERQGEIMAGWGVEGARQVADIVEEVMECH